MEDTKPTHDKEWCPQESFSAFLWDRWRLCAGGRRKARGDEGRDVGEAESQRMSSPFWSDGLAGWEDTRMRWQPLSFMSQSTTDHLVQQEAGQQMYLAWTPPYHPDELWLWPIALANPKLHLPRKATALTLGSLESSWEAGNGVNITQCRVRHLW